MKYVYILESEDGLHWYVGMTRNLRLRLQEHNDGKSTHTSKYGGWTLQTFIGFRSDQRAAAFEKYLKSHSGRAFAKKRL